MKITSNLGDLIRARTILRQTSRGLDLPDGAWIPSESWADDQSWYVGMKWVAGANKTGGDRVQILSRVEIERPFRAWFGYMSDHRSQPSLEVWFSCDTDSEADQLLEKLQLHYGPSAQRDPASLQPIIIVSVPTHGFSSDADWFKEVFGVADEVLHLPGGQQDAAA